MSVRKALKLVATLSVLIVEACATAPGHSSAWPISRYDAGSTFDREDWLKDFEILKTQLEASYPNLLWKASNNSDVDIPVIAERAERALENAQSAREAYYAIEDFLLDIQDGHIDIAPFPLSFAPPPPAESREFFANARSACASLGYSHREGGSYSLPFEKAGEFELISDWRKSALRVGVATMSGGEKIAIVRVGTFLSENFVAACEAKVIEASLPISELQWPRHCGPSCSQKLRALVVAHSITMLERDLNEAAKRGADLLLADVSRNAGGESWAFDLAAAISDKPLPQPKIGIVSDGRFDRYLTDRIENLTALGDSEAADTNMRDAARQSLSSLLQYYSKAASKRNCKLDWVWREKRDWSAQQFKECGQVAFPPMDVSEGVVASPRVANARFTENAQAQLANEGPIWSGELAVLVDRNSASAAELFAGYLQDNGAAFVVGEKTLGAGCGFVDYGSPIILPRTGVSVTLPDCVILRQDGSNSVGGVSPDIELSAQAGDHPVAIARKILLLMEK